MAKVAAPLVAQSANAVHTSRECFTSHLQGQDRRPGVGAFRQVSAGPAERLSPAFAARVTEVQIVRVGTPNATRSRRPARNAERDFVWLFWARTFVDEP